MRYSIRTFLVLLFPVFAYAQDTAVVKHQAQILVDASIKGNYSIVSDHTYPKIVEGVGGKDKMTATIKKAYETLKAQGVTFEMVAIGSPGKFYKAGTEIHCLIPESIVLNTPNGKLINNSYLLAVSRDGGKYWYFLDINGNTYKLVPKMFPNFNKDLIIPEPTPPVAQ